MKPIHLQPVLLALFLILPGVACPETNGFTEWVRLSDMVGELMESEGRPNRFALQKAYGNPEPLPEEITEHLQNAAPVFDQLKLLAAQTEWPPIDPETYTIENISPIEIQHILHLGTLLNLQARNIFEGGDAEGAWALIHSFKNSLQYLDGNGTLITSLAAAACRQMFFTHQLRLMSELSDEGLEQAIVRQKKSLEKWVSAEDRTKGELHFGLNMIDHLFDLLKEPDQLQQLRDDFLEKLRKTDKGRALAEQIGARELLSFEPWKVQVRDLRMRLREFELESYPKVPQRTIEDFYAFRESRSKDDEQVADAEDLQKKLLRILKTTDPETLDLEEIQQLHETFGQSVKEMVFQTILPATFRADLSFRKDLALQRKLMVYLAAEAYFRSNDKMPDSLEALLEEEPRLAPDHIQDPFVPHPLRINRDDGHWRLYSVGENLEDHGGKEVPGQRKQDDWFLYFREGYYP